MILASISPFKPFLKIKLAIVLLGVFCYHSTCLAVPVFRSTDSTLPSGDYSIKKLRKNQKRIISKSWFYVQNGRKKAWVEHSQVYHLWDFVFKATTAEETPAREFAFWNSPVKTSLKAQSEVQIITTQDHWAFVMDLKSGKSWWVNSLSLTPVLNDFGMVLTTQITALFSQYDADTEKMRVPAATRLRVHSIIGDRFKVTYADKKGSKHPGFIDIKSTLSVLNFAVEVSSGEDVWHHVIKRTSPKMTLAHGKKMSIEDISALKLTSSIVWTRSAETPLYRSPDNKSPIQVQLNKFDRLIIKKNKTLRWAASKINKQLLWWHFAKPLPKVTESLSTKQLFARKVFAMESSPIKSNVMFASAKGVFKSQDGKNWKSIDTFESKDYPIAIAPAGTVLIGPYRSDDHGRTFQEYIRWHKIAKVISRNSKSQTSFMEIRKLKIHDRDGRAYSLTIDNGEKLISVGTRNGGKTWFLD